MASPLTNDEIEHRLNQYNYNLINVYTKTTGNRKRKFIDFEDRDGFKYRLETSRIHGNDNRLNFVNKSNPYSIENIRLWLEINNKSFILKENNIYVNARRRLRFHCLICDEDFLSAWTKIYEGSGCAVCAGKQVGEKNSLAYVRADIMHMWSSRNRISPQNITYGSNKKAWWCCPTCEREWYTSIYNVSVQNKGCPYCAAERNESTIATELKKYCVDKYQAVDEYRELRNPKTDNWLPYDIFIPRYSAYIEVQGSQHFIKAGWDSDETFKYRKWKDKVKKRYAQNNGIYIAVDLRKIKTIEDAIEYLEECLDE